MDGNVPVDKRLTEIRLQLLRQKLEIEKQQALQRDPRLLRQQNSNPPPPYYYTQESNQAMNEVMMFELTNMLSMQVQQLEASLAKKKELKQQVERLQTYLVNNDVAKQKETIDRIIHRWGALQDHVFSNSAPLVRPIHLLQQHPAYYQQQPPPSDPREYQPPKQDYSETLMMHNLQLQKMIMEQMMSKLEGSNDANSNSNNRNTGHSYGRRLLLNADRGGNQHHRPNWRDGKNGSYSDDEYDSDLDNSHDDHFSDDEDSGEEKKNRHPRDHRRYNRGGDVPDNKNQGKQHMKRNQRRRAHSHKNDDEFNDDGDTDNDDNNKQTVGTIKKDNNKGTVETQQPQQHKDEQVHDDVDDDIEAYLRDIDAMGSDISDDDKVLPTGRTDADKDHSMVHPRFFTGYRYNENVKKGMLKLRKVLAAMRFVMILEKGRKRRVAQREECRKGMEEFIANNKTGTETYISKIVKLPLMSVLSDPSLDLGVVVEVSPERAKRRLFGKSVHEENQAKAVKIKAKVKSIIELLEQSVDMSLTDDTGDREQATNRIATLRFTKALTAEHVLFPNDYLFENEKNDLQYDAHGASIVISPYRAKILIINYFITRILIMRVLLNRKTINKKVAKNLRMIAIVLSFIAVFSHKREFLKRDMTMLEVFDKYAEKPLLDELKFENNEKKFYLELFSEFVLEQAERLDRWAFSVYTAATNLNEPITRIVPNYYAMEREELHATREAVNAVIKELEKMELARRARSAGQPFFVPSRGDLTTRSLRGESVFIAQKQSR